MVHLYAGGGAEVDEEEAVWPICPIVQLTASTRPLPKGRLQIKAFADKIYFICLL